MTTIVRMLHNPASRLLDHLITALKKGKLCVVDLSMLSGEVALILSGLILQYLFNENQKQFTTAEAQTIPVIAVLEEAQSVLVLQLYLRRKQSLSVMIKPRHGLMSPSPIKPSPNMNQRNNLLPKDFFQEASHFRNRQGHRSPRLRLNAVKLWKEPLPFFRRSDGIPCARMTVK